MFALKTWIAEQLQGIPFTIMPVQGDASFRSYYRVHTDNATYIVMFAPPGQERTDIFVHIARAWKAHGLMVPTVLAWEQTQGFVMLSDFGDALLLDTLTPHTATHFYQQALQNLLLLQTYQQPLPLFDETYIRRELGLFKEWFLEKLLGITLTPSEEILLENTYQKLLDNIASQPQVTIHRDYHSRNLMVLHTQHLGIIDFQDAMQGPITYDAVSLLKDCYIQWPRTEVCQWVNHFRTILASANNTSYDPVQFLHWFDLTGLQRHLKVLGIFSRLKIRDQKERYMQDIPRILQYVLEVTGQYPHLQEYDTWLRTLLENHTIDFHTQVAVA